jgi:predicted Kef-type K+ transport protein
MALGLFLAAAVVGGLLAKALRLPPLVGYLAAGFALGFMGVAEPAGLEQIAELGVVLLLFAIGLKFDLRTLLRKEIWLTTSLHALLSTAVGMGFIGLLAVIVPAAVGRQSFGTLALIGFALSFSSTVFVVKVLEDRSATTGLYGRIAVGVLVLQDIAAAVFMALAGGKVPSPWALALVLLVPAAWLLHRIWDRIGHGELQALFGVTVAVGLGWGLFEAVGVHGVLGALVMGVLLAKHPSAAELSRSLMTFKDLLLVAFFLQIGLHGRPGLDEVLLAVALLAVLPLQVAFYAVLLWAMRMRRRTAFLAALVLGNFSEFGIIVAVIGAEAGLLAERWVMVISLAVAMSFAASALVNRRGVELATRMVPWLPHHSTPSCTPTTAWSTWATPTPSSSGSAGSGWPRTPGCATGTGCPCWASSWTRPGWPSCARRASTCCAPTPPTWSSGAASSGSAGSRWLCSPCRSTAPT